MTRGRKTDEEEAAREMIEGHLASLGVARVYVGLVGLLVAEAIRTDDTKPLGSAKENLEEVETILQRVQKQIKGVKR